MPNLDGGHYFLTVLAPIRTDTVIDPVVGRSRSHVHTLAQKLALLAAGPQTAETPPDAWPSPFSRNKLNHFARFVIINGPNYNGRESGDSVLATLTGVNPLTPQPVDELSRPYLVFAADFDAPSGTDADLTAYATALWQTMADDLSVIFGHCCGFEGVGTADAFAAYLRSCQVETTFGFNDYWADGLKAPPGQPPIGLLKVTGILTLVVLVGWLAAVAVHGLLAVLGMPGGWIVRVAACGLPATLVAAALLALAVLNLYRWAMTNGAKPFPRAPGGDLATILKALFLQQAFTRFAIEAQGLSDADLHRRFGAFLAATQPGDTNNPPTFPGRFQAPHVEWPR
jgi:hypothetical protein